MTMPRPDPATRDHFHALVPDDPRVTVRPMFGQLAAFVHRSMCTGIFGSDVFFRLGQPDREELLAQPGAEEFEPMPGRAPALEPPPRPLNEEPLAHPGRISSSGVPVRRLSPGSETSLP